ncbi:dynactin subunit 3 [Megachile rotundata]|uniref:dynactin subunit 3 n=1 Tax=Megachile rotundata TaxID=143995 RepID=UPI000258D9C0|nr:PREDICTED: dynactin subunit 3 [Megachile rotundata]
MGTIELLEDRIANLEKQIYGLTKANQTIDTIPKNPVTDQLLNVNTLITSALSRREKANAAVERLPELNDYLDPVCESLEIPAEAKVQLLLAMAPEIKKNYEMLKQMQELMPVLETDHLKDVPELSNKLSTLNLSYLKLHDESQELNNHINELLSKYNEVITGISKSLIAMDATVLDAEIAAMPKKQLD